MKEILMALAGIALLVATSGSAHAAGLEMDATALPATTRTSLAKEIADARTQRPELFRAVADAIANAETLDAHARRRGIPFTPRFKALGPNALFPMLEALAFDAHAPSGLSESARYALRVGLLEAVGGIRDPRALPVLEHVLERATDVRIVRGASTAIARIGTDAAVTALLRAEEAAHQSEPNGARERALLAGMHDARRAAIAKLLASRFDSADDDTARIIVHSLGGVANAWSWRALADKTELAETRDVAARALVKAFAGRPGETREAAAKAILVVDAPQTAQLLAQARASANADVARQIDDLDRRFRENPARIAP